ncbi:hypothetical protein [Streptomyces sp. NPDC020917]|uniref:hypothetical protein n=1 Tax=Streptomyces sp. NPDC020917 TaxID=3365102 RepID=UPI0037A946D5
MTPPPAHPVRIARSGTPGNPHAHLDPLVEAEIRWGNEVAEDWHITDPHFGYWGLTLARPFHVDELRAHFTFPPSFTLGVTGSRPGGQKPSMSLGDRLNFVGISAPIPPGWPDADTAIPLGTA